MHSIMHSSISMHSPIIRSIMHSHTRMHIICWDHRMHIMYSSMHIMMERGAM